MRPAVNRRSMRKIMGTQILERARSREIRETTLFSEGDRAFRQSKAVIGIKELSVVYPGKGTGQPDRTAVKGLTLSVRSGEVFGFLGPNGAGKTTTMNVLLGFVNASSGEPRLFGTDVLEPIARQPIGYLPE